MKNDGLNIEIENGTLTISVGIECLIDAWKLIREGSPEGDEVRITDYNLLAEDVLQELTSTDETGESPVTLLLDQAVSDAIQMGSQGIDIIEPEDEK